MGRIHSDRGPDQRGTWDTDGRDAHRGKTAREGGHRPGTESPQEKASPLAPRSWPRSCWNCEKINHCCLSHAGHSALLWQPSSLMTSCAASGKSLHISGPGSPPATWVITELRANVCDTQGPRVQEVVREGTEGRTGMLPSTGKRGWLFTSA